MIASAKTTPKSANPNINRAMLRVPARHRP
jgi:hypothetical protein